MCNLSYTDLPHIRMIMPSTQMFIIHNSYPKWTPVSIMTQDGETTHFLNHFPSWPCVDLNLASKSKELHLPFVQQPEVTYPVTGQTKVCGIQSLEVEKTTPNMRTNVIWNVFLHFTCACIPSYARVIVRSLLCTDLVS